MTHNEYEAKRIAGFTGRWQRIYGYQEVNSTPDCEKAALMMAKTKDNEFLEFLNELTYKQLTLTEIYNKISEKIIELKVVQND
jgi:hypothetical protein